VSRRKRGGKLRSHLKFGLICSSPKLCGWHARNDASAEEPFVALIDVVCIGVRDVVLGNALLCALRFSD
jgi:hypothetical protein